MKKNVIAKMVTVFMILLLAGCGKTTRASEPEVAETAEQTEIDATTEEAAEAEEAAETETAEEAIKEAETTEETAEEPEVSEEERLAAFVSSLKELDPVKDRNSLNSELVSQKAVIQYLLSAKTEQVSPCQEGNYPIIRVFNGFVLVDSDGRVKAYQDSRHLHFKDDGWEILDGHGIETIEDNAIVWKTGESPFWALAQREDRIYLFYWLMKADAAEDHVFSSYNADIRQRVKAIVSEAKAEGKVSQENYNLLESIAFQLSIKEVSSKDYCIVQYLTRKKCRGTDWSARTLVNIEVDDEGVPQSINSEEPSLIVLEDDLAIKVTIVTDEEVTPEVVDD